jgi:hypothetical protein
MLQDDQCVPVRQGVCQVRLLSFARPDVIR